MIIHMMMKCNMKISFDFDSTLTRPDVQEFAKQCIESGHEVWLVTSRQDTESALQRGHHWVESQNQKLFEVAEQVGIDANRIVFTSHQPKIEFLAGKEFTIHIDDDIEELLDIKISKDPCVGVNVEYFEWKEITEKLLK